MIRVIALLTLLVFLPHTAHAQTVSASVYRQFAAPASAPLDPTPEEQAVAIRERLVYANDLAGEQNWEDAGRALREALRIDRDNQRVRLAILGVRNHARPSFVLRLDPLLQQALLDDAEHASALSTAGHVLGVMGAAGAGIGLVLILVGALGLAFSSLVSAATGTPGGHISFVAPWVGTAGGIGLALAVVGGSLHAVAAGHQDAIHLTLHPSVHAEGGGLVLSGRF